MVSHGKHMSEYKNPEYKKKDVSENVNGKQTIDEGTSETLEVELSIESWIRAM